ncbi:MAG: DUF427 domain-containing protein, partial [Ilumatobacter sp.]
MSDRPAAEGVAAGWFPGSPVEAGHVEWVPRRIRAVIDGRTVIDTTRARYVWEHAFYPQFYVPAADVEASLIIRTGRFDNSHQPDGEMLYLDTPSGLVPAGSFVAES